MHVYHKRGNDYIKRGEIVGLFHAPEYKASESFAATLEEPKDDLYQIKIRDEETDRIMLSTVKYVNDKKALCKVRPMEQTLNPL